MNQIDLKGRVAVVTGGAQGIGHAITERLLASGARAILWDIDRAKLDEALAVLGKLGPVSGEVVELTDDAAVAAATKKAGAIDILVNNAGLIRGGPDFDVTKTTLAQWQKVLDVNLTGAFLMCRAVVPSMRTRGWGRIVNIASRAGRTGVAEGGLHYSASKAGLIGMTRTLAMQCAPQAITANCVAPGRVTTAMTRVAAPAVAQAALQRIPLGREASPDEIAGVVAFLCSDDGAYVTGAVIDANGGSFMG